MTEKYRYNLTTPENRHVIVQKLSTLEWIPEARGNTQWEEYLLWREAGGVTELYEDTLEDDAWLNSGAH
jgi:hypothetical protein